MPVLRRPLKPMGNIFGSSTSNNRTLKRRFGRLHGVRGRVLVLLCICTLIFLTVHLFPRQHLLQTSKPNGYTTAGSPLFAKPEPYGVAAPVMAVVLPLVHQYVHGGVRVDDALLQASADSEHLHGRLLGFDPVSTRPAWAPTPFNFSQETTQMKTEAHTKTCFNKRRSNSLPLDRLIPDVRSAKCMKEWYYQNQTVVRPSRPPGILWRSLASLGLATLPRAVPLPSTSVVFVFYNEPLSTLLRAVYSVLDRTPPHLLHEIILVDDGSDDEAPWLAEGAEFEKHLQLLPKTRLARCTGRNGLMRARNIGASLATGQTISYLDSHIEVNVGWVEPLMGRIAEGLRDGVDHVVVPVIDAIDADTFKYKKGGIDILGHTWGLGQTAVPNRLNMEEPSPKRSPIMAGGLLSFSREFFDKLGFYDPEMELWGGEEMEISFRIWLCGGTLECMPCSRVGHVFRSPKYWQGQVYKVPGEVIARNKLRASYWMQEYGELVKLSAAPLGEGMGIGSMKHYENIRRRLQCKPYRWYLENVYPSLLDSANKLMGDREVRRNGFDASGYMKNPKFEVCLDSLHHKPEGSVFGVYPCHYMRGSQSALYTRSKLVLQGEYLLDGCLTRGNDSKLVKRQCRDELKRQQSWNMEDVERKGQRFVRMTAEGNCLTVVQQEEEEQKSAFTLRMKPCGGEVSEDQEWEWESTSSRRSR